MEEIKLIKIKNPFDKHDRTEELVDYHNENLLTIRNAYFPKEIDVVVSVNGGVVQEKDLMFITLRPGDEVVFIPNIEGGGDIFRAVAMLAVVAVAIWAPYAMGLYSTMTVWGGTAELAFATQVATGLTFGGALVSAGIMMAGGFLVNALLPPPSPDVEAFGGSFDNSNTYSWSPITKQQQGLVIPKFYGTIPVYGNIISTYTENISDKNYLNVLLHVGQGPINRLYDFYINDQPSTNLSGIETLATRYGYINQKVISNFNDTKTEYTAGVKCTYNTPYTYTTTGDAFDGLEVDISFPRGLYYANDRGSLSDVSVDIQVAARKQGDSAWIPLTTKSVSVAYTTTSYYWSKGYWATTYGYERTTSETTWCEVEQGSSDSTEHYEGEYAGRTDVTGADGYTYTYHFYWRWMSVIGTEYTDETVNYATVTDHKNSAIIKTYKTDTNLSHGKYDIKVTRLTTDYTDARYGADSYLSTVREVVKDDFTYPCSALVGIKALATDQLSGSFKFKCMEEGALIRYYDGSNWQIGFNNNPAWVCYDILTQPLFADPDEVIGTDGLNYRCILAHTSSNSNKPITGGSYATYWAQTGENGVEWQDSTSYKSWDATALRYDGINPSRLDTTSFKEWADWCDELVLSGKDENAVSSASEVIGTDGLNYKSKVSSVHSSSIDDRPITGDNWGTYWELGGVDGGPWRENEQFYANSPYVTLPISSGTLTDTTKCWYNNIHRNKVVEIYQYSDDEWKFIERRVIVSNTENTLTVSPNWTATLDINTRYYIKQNYERRFMFNGGFDAGTSLWEAALQVALMSRALLIWDGTTIKALIDREVTLPDDATQLFSMANIYVDSFEETFLSSSERSGEIEINFVNKDIDYEKDSIIVLNTSLNKPENRNTISLIGTTSPSQAWRMGYFFLKQNELLKRTIKFDADVDAISCTIGDIIYFQHDVPRWGICGGRVAASSQVLGGSDGLNYTCILSHTATANDRPGMVPATPNWATYWAQTGDSGATWVSGSSYIASSTSNTITLDQEVTIEAGKSYSIMVWLNDDTLVTKAVTTSPSTTSELTISGTWTTNPSEYDRYAFGESDSVAKPFKVLEVSRTGDLKCTIRAIEYDANVYDLTSEAPLLPTFSHSARDAIDVVTNIRVSEIASVNESGASNRTLLVRFDKPVNIYYHHAEIWYKADSGPYEFAGETPISEFSINNISPNTTYTILIRSVSHNNDKTSMLNSPTDTYTTSRELTTYADALKSRITGLEIFNQRNSDTFTGKDCKFKWNPLSAVDESSTGAGNEALGAGTYIPPIWLKDYEVKIYDSYDTLRRTEYVLMPEYTYTFEKNYEDGSGTPVRNFQIQVKARDIMFRTSEIPAKLTVTNAAPIAMRDISVTSGTGYYIVEFTPSTEPDILGYRVYASQTSGFTPSSSTLVSDGANTRVIVSPSQPGLWYVKVAAYDTFGSIDLNFSAEYSVNVANWLEYDDIELEFMKMSFNSVSWAQFAVYDDFVLESKREVPDPFTYEATRYKNSIVASGNLANTVYGWTSKTYNNVTTVETGTSTSVGVNFLTDTSKNWYIDEVRGLTLVDVDLHTFTILSNTSDTLTISGTPSAGAYQLRDDNPAYMVCFCSYEDSTEAGGNGFVKMEVSFTDGAHWQTVLDTENDIDLLEGTVAIDNPGVDYKVRFSLKTDNDGNSPVVKKYLVCTDPSCWRY